MLSAKRGKCIRFRATDVRLFKGRESSGVRGMDLEDGDAVISLTILRHVDVSPAEARAYVKLANAQRRAADEDGNGNGDENGNGDDVTLTQERFEELAWLEQMILSITENGYGKRTSAYEYRVTNRGGKGIINIVTSARNGDVVESGPIEEGDQIVLVTDGGKLIRLPIDDIRIAGRNTQGVTLFNVAADERVVSVTRLSDTGEDNNGGDGEANGNGADPGKEPE
ncbi:MAG: hypothetical protein MI806_07870, partial [Minwuiales bacterium]|nr:hypothetical protein [Minwuiales bacterium]